jgi:hypothetical protein
MHYSTSTTIDATPEAIWDILVDISTWTDWNTTVATIEGTAALGGKVKLRVKANPGRAFQLNAWDSTGNTGTSRGRRSQSCGRW